MDAHPHALAMLATQAQELDPFDWAAHRELAQRAAALGFTARVTQEFTNCVGDRVSHETSIDAVPVDDESEPRAPIVVDEGPMGSTTSVETFSRSDPHGYFGPRTPLEYMP